MRNLHLYTIRKRYGEFSRCIFNNIENGFVVAYRGDYYMHIIPNIDISYWGKSSVDRSFRNVIMSIWIDDKYRANGRIMKLHFPLSNSMRL
jgi:hypothetical protein